MRNEITLFGTTRLSQDEAVELTINSLKAYAEKHKHWAIAWSGGKDSTTIATLVLQLITIGLIPKPETLTILYADTRMELTPLWISAKILMDQMRQRGFVVKEVMAPIEKRFLVYILGRGVPPPSNTFRWCTGHIKVEPMEAALQDLYWSINAGKNCSLDDSVDTPIEKILMITGVRQGESAIRDGRIAMSCGKDGAECGQGWYQTGLDTDICSTLAPILHWRVCHVWDWLGIYAPSKRPDLLDNFPGLTGGQWHTTMVADAYGGADAEDINARTGCIGCPLVETDLALDTILKDPEWKYLQPLKGLKPIYRQMRKPQNRLRQPGGEKRKDGTYSKNQQRMGPLTMQARENFFEQILQIQYEINDKAERLERPKVDILNAKEVEYIFMLWDKNTWPDGWTGEEPVADQLTDKFYPDGSVMPYLFKNL